MLVEDGGECRSRRASSRHLRTPQVPDPKEQRGAIWVTWRNATTGQTCCQVAQGGLREGWRQRLLDESAAATTRNSAAQSAPGVDGDMAWAGAAELTAIPVAVACLQFQAGDSRHQVKLREVEITVHSWHNLDAACTK